MPTDFAKAMIEPPEQVETDNFIAFLERSCVTTEHQHNLASTTFAGKRFVQQTTASDTAHMGRQILEVAVVGDVFPGGCG